MIQIKKHSSGKKLLALLLALMMIISMLPTSVFAAEVDLPTEDIQQPVSDEAPVEEETPVEEVSDVEDAPQEDTPVTTALGDIFGTATTALTIAAKPADGTTTGQPFIAGQTGGASNKSFRIPAMVTLDDGTIVAAADARWNMAYDGGGNDTIVTYSKDNGDTWHYTYANYMGDNNYVWNKNTTTFIDPTFVSDGKTVYMMVDLYSYGRSIGTQNTSNLVVNGSGFNSDGYLKLAKGSSTSYTYYLKDGQIYNSSNQVVEGYSVDAYFNITGTDGTESNLFYSDSPYRVYPTGYLYFNKSTDGGATWSQPTLIGLNTSDESACLIGVGRGAVTDNGTIVFPFYAWSGVRTGFIYSTDEGKTWQRSDSGISNSSEASIVKLNDGTLRVFYRYTGSGNTLHYVDVKETAPGSFSWGSKKTVSVAVTSDCLISAIKYSKTVNGNETILVSCPTSGSRSKGKIYLFDAATMTKLAEHTVTESYFQYSALTELNDNTIALLYENFTGTPGSIQYVEYDPADIFSGVTFDEVEEPEEPSVPITDAATGVTATFDNSAVKAMTVATATVTELENADNIDYVAFDIQPDSNYSTENKPGATVTVPLGDLANANGFTAFYTENGELKDVTGTNNGDGTYTFVVPHFSVVGVYAVTGVGDDGNDDEGTPSDNTVITVTQGNSTTLTVTYPAGTEGLVDGSTETENFAASWTVKAETEKNDSSWVKVNPAAGTYKISDGNGNYLKLNATWSGSSYYGRWSYSLTSTTNASEATDWTFAQNGNGYRISAASPGSGDSSTVYLRYYWGLTTTTSSDDATAWTWNSNGIYNDGSWNDYYLNYGSSWSTQNGSGNGGVYTYNEGTETDIGYTVTITVHGKKVSYNKNAFVIGDKTFDVEVVDTIIDSTDVTLKVGDSLDLDVTAAKTTGFSHELKDGEKVTWSIADASKVGLYSTENGKATLFGRAEGNTTVTATVKNAEGKTVAIYTYNVTVSGGSANNTGNYRVTHSLTTSVYNGRLYYSFDGGPLIEPELESETTDADGNILRKYKVVNDTTTNVSKHITMFFIAPDEGYALTAIKDAGGTTASQFYPVDAENLTVTLKKPNGTDHSGGKPETYLTTDQYKAMMMDAVEKGCDGAFWNSRNGSGNGLTGNDNITANYIGYCDKLPTIEKTINSLLVGNTAYPYKEGLIADKDNKLVFEIKITGYAETSIKSDSGDYSGIKYTDPVLRDNLAGVTLYTSFENGVLSGEISNPYTADTFKNQLDADRTDGNKDYITLYAAYTLTEDDLKSGREIENTVDFTYTYSSNFSYGSYQVASKASAAAKMTDFPTIKDIVVDYGLPVKVTDKLKWGENYNGIISVSDYTSDYRTENFNSVTYTGDNKDGLTVTYYPCEQFMKNGTVDNVTLISSREGNTTSFKVIPATTVYYEDSFVTTTPGTGSAAGATWATDGTTNSNAYQALDYLGSQKIYGNDAAYANCTEFSLGSAQKVTVTSDMANGWNDASSWPQAQFTFTGTGFDVISLTDNNSGLISYDIYKGTEVTGTPLLSRVVNNYYGYKYVDGEFTQTNDVENALYQLPVIKIDDLDYGQYTVVIKAAYGSFFDNTGDNQYSFWLDAVRVYNPLGTNGNTYYEQDNEGYAQFFELHDALVKAEKYQAVLIEGTTEADKVEYTNMGPNHEVYLGKNQSLAFKLSGDLDSIASVQIGLKAVDGAVNYTLNNGTTGTISTATDMFYDITALAKNGGNVIIANTGNTILSLTNVKVTFKYFGESVTMTMNDVEAQAAVMAVRAMFAVEETPEVPETPETPEAPETPEVPEEPETFEPERFDVSWKNSTVTAGKKATLTVKTSEDVDAIVVNGQTITDYRTRKELSGWGWNAKKVVYREFTYTVTATETTAYTVSAVNADGIESASTTTTLTVNPAEQKPSFGSWLEDLFSRWF